MYRIRLEFRLQPGWRRSPWDLGISPALCFLFHRLISSTLGRLKAELQTGPEVAIGQMDQGSNGGSWRGATSKMVVSWGHEPDGFGVPALAGWASIAWGAGNVSSAGFSFPTPSTLDTWPPKGGTPNGAGSWKAAPVWSAATGRSFRSRRPGGAFHLKGSRAGAPPGRHKEKAVTGHRTPYRRRPFLRLQSTHRSGRPGAAPKRAIDPPFSAAGRWPR
jgi:hypothetical protein